MDKLFLDANIFFSAAYKVQAGISKIASLVNVQLITSNYALEEAKRNLQQPSQLKRLNTLMQQVSIHTEYDDTVIPHDIQLRDKDRPILSAAISTHSDYLITGDVRDFGCFYGKRIAGVMILSPSQYLQFYNKNK